MAILRGLLARPEHRSPCLNPVFPTRRLDCPHCGTTFDAARKAVTLNCPGCRKPLQFQNRLIRASTAENLTTMGEVRIARKGSLQGRIDCGTLIVEGAISGDITVRGEARIEPRGRVAGHLNVRTLIVEPGARISARISIQPDQSSTIEAGAPEIPAPSPAPGP